LRQAQEDLRWTRHLADEGAYHLTRQAAMDAVALAEEVVSFVTERLTEQSS
jgi:hypothetical protein